MFTNKIPRLIVVTGALSAAIVYFSIISIPNSLADTAYYKDTDWGYAGATPGCILKATNPSCTAFGTPMHVTHDSCGEDPNTLIEYWVSGGSSNTCGTVLHSTVYDCQLYCGTIGTQGICANATSMTCADDTGGGGPPVPIYAGYCKCY